MKTYQNRNDYHHYYGHNNQNQTNKCVFLTLLNKDRFCTFRTLCPSQSPSLSNVHFVRLLAQESLILTNLRDIFLDIFHILISPWKILLFGFLLFPIKILLFTKSDCILYSDDKDDISLSGIISDNFHWSLFFLICAKTKWIRIIRSIEIIFRLF